MEFGGIWFLRPGGVDEGGEEEEGEILPMCESIGHWPFLARCPKKHSVGLILLNCVVLIRFYDLVFTFIPLPFPSS